MAGINKKLLEEFRKHEFNEKDFKLDFGDEITKDDIKAMTSDVTTLKAIFDSEFEVSLNPKDKTKIFLISKKRVGFLEVSTVSKVTPKVTQTIITYKSTAFEKGSVSLTISKQAAVVTGKK